MTAVEVLSMTAAICPSPQREGFHVSLARAHGASWRAPPRDRVPRFGIRHLRTRAHRPQTSGKAERLIHTMLSGWAYGAIYRNSDERTAALDGWLWHHNCQRRHLDRSS